MSAEQAESAPEGSFAVLRAGRHGLPVFCGSLDEALKVAKTSTEQSGGKYLVLRVLGSVRAEAHWTARAEPPQGSAAPVAQVHWNAYP